MEKHELLMQFINNRPECLGAFGYGSKIFTQLGYTTKTKAQYDIIFIVHDMAEWHRKNCDMNPKDYSYIGKKYLTTDRLESIKGHTKMTFQSNIKEDGATFKYGVIEYFDFIHNLSTWDSFFVTGRFQKPIYTLNSNTIINSVIDSNRKDGLYVALLTMNPSSNKLTDIYESLCNLSYIGDTRMKIAENPKKVSNIVGGNLEFFKNTYGTENKFFSSSNDDTITIDHEELLCNINQLPLSLLEYLESNHCNKDDLFEIRSCILNYLKEKNHQESKEQTLKGIKTNGIVKSLRYAIPKVMKKVKSFTIKG